METSNGHIDLNAVADQLQDDMSVGYRPTMPLEALWLSGTDMPQITLRRDIEFMQMHPIVIAALDYYKGGLFGAQFWGGTDHADPMNTAGRPVSPNPAVAEFVLSHVEKFWQFGMPLMQDGGYPYGWGAGEHMYCEREGRLCWSHVKDFHPNDVFVLSCSNQPVGIRVKSIKSNDGAVGDHADLWYASASVPAKACWYPHRPRFNRLYGRSQLIGAWRPWRRLGWRDGVEQVIDAAIYRGGYSGPIVKHPLEDAQTAKPGIPATQNDGQGNPRRSARDVARQMVEWAKAGAGFTMSSAKYPMAQGGGDKWAIDWPTQVMDVMPLVNAARYMEDQVFHGVGTPPELVRASGTGSGYSGRSIPREGFLGGQQHLADAMLYVFVEQVVRPLVLWNFGDVPFDVRVKSLLQSQAEDKQGAASAGPGGRARGPDGKFLPTLPQQGLAMSAESQLRVAEIAKKVLGRLNGR